VPFLERGLSPGLHGWYGGSEPHLLQELRVNLALDSAAVELYATGGFDITAGLGKDQCTVPAQQLLSGERAAP
jgi:hypothetical protein